MDRPMSIPLECCIVFLGRNNVIQFLVVCTEFITEFPVSYDCYRDKYKYSTKVLLYMWIWGMQIMNIKNQNFMGCHCLYAHH